MLAQTCPLTVTLRLLAVGLLLSPLVACGGEVLIPGKPGQGQPGGARGGAADQPAADSARKPAPETCNGFDDDLDGTVDEGCSCNAGHTQPCFPSKKRAIKGLCKQGKQACQGSGEFGSWGACVGAVTPKKEICGDGIDQDCDGTDLTCAPKCGDHKCNGSETCRTCPADCGKCAPGCGDGTCDKNESCQSCPGDCGKCPTTCESFKYGVTTRPVDIVWIIDQSGSMNTEIASVKQHMNAFASYISASNIDYRVIVLARSGSGTYDICIPPPLGGPGCSNASRFMQVNVAVYSTDSLSKLQQHITSIESFMRKGSLRHFVEVSDDNSRLSAASFHGFLKARAGYKDYVFHSIVGLSAGGCVARVGQEYKNLSSWTNGLMQHICNANWSTVFNALGKKVLAAGKNQFKLKHSPIGGTAKVSYGTTPATFGSQWVFDPAQNRVGLVGKLPANGTTIRICYSYKR